MTRLIVHHVVDYNDGLVILSAAGWGILDRLALKIRRHPIDDAQEASLRDRLSLDDYRLIRALLSRDEQLIVDLHALANKKGIKQDDVVAQARLLAERGYLAMDDAGAVPRVRVLMKAKLEIAARGAELDAVDVVQRLRQPRHDLAPKPEDIYTLLSPPKIGIIDTHGFGKLPFERTPSASPVDVEPKAPWAKVAGGYLLKRIDETVWKVIQQVLIWLAAIAFAALPAFLGMQAWLERAKVLPPTAPPATSSPAHPPSVSVPAASQPTSPSAPTTTP